MRRKLMTMLALLTALSCSWAQTEEEGRQILVFRNTGEVNLFYSNELDSITTNDTAQVFHGIDTTLIVPYSELDSVAVGSRNNIILNREVRQLTDDVDIPWLIRTDRNSLYYRKETPAALLPKIGERLYYAESCDRLPYGLAAKVISITLHSDEYEVVVGKVDLAEIFDRLFYAGRLETKPNTLDSNSLRRAPSRTPASFVEPIPLEGILPLNEMGDIHVDGETNITADFVVDVQRHYYHAHIRGNTALGFNWTLRSEDSAKETATSPKLEIPLPVIAGVLHPVVYANIFCDVTAELRFQYVMKRNYVFEYEWTRKNGKNEFANKTPTGEKNQFEDEAKMEVLLNGEVYAGAEVGVGLNLVGDRAGVRIGVQAGPYLSGEFGAGVLTQLREYQSAYYNKAEMKAGMKLRVNASYFDHEYFWLFGNEVEHTLYTHDFNLFPTTFHLFPQYERSRAVAQTDVQCQTTITTASAIPEPPISSLETGFELVDNTGEVIDSTFVGKIMPLQKENVKEQVFNATLDCQNGVADALENYKVRPVFHYAGYTVSAESIGISKDMNLQPYTATHSNGSMSFVSSGPFLGMGRHNGTLYTIGSYMPVPAKKKQSDF